MLFSCTVVIITSCPSSFQKPPPSISVLLLLPPLLPPLLLLLALLLTVDTIAVAAPVAVDTVTGAVVVRLVLEVGTTVTLSSAAVPN